MSRFPLFASDAVFALSTQKKTLFDWLNFLLVNFFIHEKAFFSLVFSHFSKPSISLQWIALLRDARSKALVVKTALIMKHAFETSNSFIYSPRTYVCFHCDSYYIVLIILSNSNRALLWVWDNYSLKSGSRKKLHRERSFHAFFFFLLLFWRLSVSPVINKGRIKELWIAQIARGYRSSLTIKNVGLAARPINREKWPRPSWLYGPFCSAKFCDWKTFGKMNEWTCYLHITSNETEWFHLMAEN